MVYLFIMVAVAVAGITKLWLQQRRESARLNTVDGFRQSLEKIAEQPARRLPAKPGTATRRPAGGSRYSNPPQVTSRQQPLDPVRREAAKRRIEARRRARQRVA